MTADQLQNSSIIPTSRPWHARIPFQNRGKNPTDTPTPLNKPVARGADSRNLDSKDARLLAQQLSTPPEPRPSPFGYFRVK